MWKILTGLMIMLSSVVGWADTYYVSPTGNDSNDGLTFSSAFLTLQKAADEVRLGDVVLVADGNYRGFNLFTSGTSTAPIIFRADGESVVIDSPNTYTNKDGINLEGASWVVIDGFQCRAHPRAGIRVVEANNCILRNNHCDQNGLWGIFTGFTDDLLVEDNVCSFSVSEHGIYISNSSDRSIVRNNRSHHNRGGGIQINADSSIPGGDGISSDPQIYNNILYENGLGGGAAINLDGVQGAEIYNNLLYENHATGIALFKHDGATGSSDAKIYHNTIVNASNGRWCISITNGSTGAELRNNIVINQHSFRGSIVLDQASINGFSSDYNLLIDALSPDGDATVLSVSGWQALGYDTHSLVAEALTDIFLDPNNSDYSLRQDSQALDVGVSLAFSPVQTDLLGHVRPLGTGIDLGAIEMLVPSPYGSWLVIHFTEVERNNAELESSIWGNHADPDKDGRDNFTEYAMGSNPRQIEPYSVSVALTVSEGNQYLSQKFNIAKQATDVSFKVQVSDTMKDWSDAAGYQIRESGLERTDSLFSQFIESVDTGSSYRVTERSTEAIGQQTQFMRIKMELISP